MRGVQMLPVICVITQFSVFHLKSLSMFKQENLKVNLEGVTLTVRFELNSCIILVHFIQKVR